LVEALHARHEGGATVRPFDSLDDLLANRQYQVGEGVARPLTDAVVIGHFLQVGPGQGFTVSGNDAPGGTVTDFDDPQALWRTIHGTFMIDAVISGSTSSPTAIVGFAFGAETSTTQIEKDLVSLGPVVLFLNHSEVFAYDKRVFGTVLDGALLAPVSPDGEIDLPALDEGERATFLSEAPTLSALRTAAARPGSVIQLDPSGAVVVG
jgi:hypothetical protein